jgi:hypothetical protein
MFLSRYYDSNLSIFLSVDSKASNYWWITPYAYCANNPIKLVDPNGMEIVNGLKDPPPNFEPREKINSTSSTSTSSSAASNDKGGGLFKKIGNAISNLFENRGGVWGTTKEKDYDSPSKAPESKGDAMEADLDALQSGPMPKDYFSNSNSSGTTLDKQTSQPNAEPQPQGTMIYGPGTSGDGFVQRHVSYFNKEDSMQQKNSADRKGYKYNRTVPYKP